MDALPPYSPCDECAPADALMHYVRTAFVFGMSGTTEYMGVGFHERFMALSRFQKCGRTHISCTSISDARTAFRAAPYHQGLKLFHCIADEGDVVFLPSGWLLAEKPLNSKMILGISVGAIPSAGSLDAHRGPSGLQQSQLISYGKRGHKCEGFGNPLHGSAVQTCSQSHACGCGNKGEAGDGQGMREAGCV